MVDIKINLKEYNNSGRVGTYIVVSYGNLTRNYKYNFLPGQIDATAEYFKDRYIKKINKGKYREYIERESIGFVKGRLKETSKEIKEFVKGSLSKGTIEGNLRRGSSSSRIRNILGIRNEESRDFKREIVRGLVKDEKYVKVLTSNNNFEKLKKRLDHKFIIYGKNNKLLLSGFIHNKGSEEVFRDLRRSVLESRNNVLVTEDPIMNNLKKKGYNVEQKGYGTVNRIEVTGTLRKGKVGKHR